MLRLTLNIDAVDDLRGTAAYGTGAVAVVESASSQSGTYAAMGTALLVAGQTQYELWDSSGISGTTWYRFRIANGGATAFSDYSDPFQASAISSYASLDDLIERLNLPDETRYNLLADVLVAVSAQLDVECGRGFYRIPAVSGDTTRTYDGSGADWLLVPEGIVSLTSVEVRDDVDSAWTTLGTAEWALRPSYPDPGETHRQVILTGSSSAQYADFPAGVDTVRLTGAFGWPSVPPLVREAVVEMAARVYAESQTRYGGLVGLPDGVQTVMPVNRPDAWHRAVRAYARRSGVAR